MSNSSINSQPTPVITGGDIAVIGSVNPATAGGSSVTGVAAAAANTTAGATIGTTAATTGTTATSALTTSTGAPTVAASAAFSPVLMNSTPPPQATGTTGPTLSTAST